MYYVLAALQLAAN